METFNFPFHTVETENPESGFRAQFGGSYVFSTPATDPDQRKFTLTFPGMQFFLNGTGYPEATSNPTYNMKTLIDFYTSHKMHTNFLYDHPVHGQLVVKFLKPLSEPETLPGGSGMTKSFRVELIEVP